MRTKQPCEMILCDQMLGTLSKWLRIFGLDTFYASSEISDDELLKIAKREKRMIISRDNELIIRARKYKIKNMLIKTTNLDSQLNLVFKKVHPDPSLILSRCTICNSVLKKIKKDLVKEKIPERVFENNEVYFYCSICSKYYWTGTHYKKIVERINQIKKQNVS